MSDYTVTKLDEIEEVTDGRCPWRPVRHQLGITAFGVNAFTASRSATGSSTSTTRRASTTCRRSSTSSTRAARGSSSAASASTPPAGTFVYVPPDVKRTAFAEEPGTTLVAVGGKPGAAYEPSGYELWRRSTSSTRPASTSR